MAIIYSGTSRASRPDPEADKKAKRIIRRKIGDLLDNHCNGCEIKDELDKKHGSNTSHITEYCRNNCSIGGQLIEFGNQLNTGLRPRSQFDEKPIIEKETIEMNEQTKPELTKEIYLKEREAGKSNVKIEKDFNMKPNSIYYLINRWGVKKSKVMQKETKPNNPVLPPSTITPELSTTNPSGDTLGRSDESKPCVTVLRDNKVSERPQQRSKRSIRIDAVGYNSVIEEELFSLLNYIKAMPAKDLKIEICLTESQRPS